MFEGVGDAIRHVLGDALTDTLEMRLGNPAYPANVNRIDVPLTETNGVGMVWVHDPSGEGGATMAENTGLYPLQARDKIFGRYVQVKRTRDRLQIVGFSRNDAEYMHGIQIADQTPVPLALFSWGLLQPSEPRSMRAFVSQAVYAGQYLVRAQETQDFTADIPTTDGYALAVLVEVDVTDGTLYYTVGDEFDATLTHENAFGLYPKSVTSGRYTVGWVRLENNMVAILEGKHLYPAQEILSKGSGTAGYLCVRDEKAQNTDGGTFTDGAWRTRDLNTIHAKSGALAGLSDGDLLTSNQVTLPAGSYRVHIICPAYTVTYHQAALYNISDSEITLLGTSAYAGSSDDTVTTSVIVGRFTIAAPTIFEVRHRCGATVADTGFGLPCNFTTEVYTVAQFERE